MWLIFPKIFTIQPYNSPDRVRYGMSIVNSKSDLCLHCHCIAILNIMSCWTILYSNSNSNSNCNGPQVNLDQELFNLLWNGHLQYNNYIYNADLFRWKHMHKHTDWFIHVPGSYFLDFNMLRLGVRHDLTHWPLGEVIIHKFYLITWCRLSSWALVKLLSGECSSTHWMISQHWFR